MWYLSIVFLYTCHRVSWDVIDIVPSSTWTFLCGLTLDAQTRVYTYGVPWHTVLGDDPSCDMEVPRSGPHDYYWEHMILVETLVYTLYISFYGLLLWMVGPLMLDHGFILVHIVHGLPLDHWTIGCDIHDLDEPDSYWCNWCTNFDWFINPPGMNYCLYWQIVWLLVILSIRSWSIWAYYNI
jgi:hypothetical protein